MKCSLLTRFTVGVIAGIPFSAFAGYAMAVYSESHILLVILALLVLTVFAKKRPTRRGRTTVDLFDQHVELTAQLWRHRYQLRIADDEIRSAICSFRDYLRDEEEEFLANLYGSAAVHADSMTSQLLNRAEEKFPAAYQALDRRGKTNRSTWVARRFFVDVVSAAMRDCADSGLYNIPCVQPRSGVNHSTTVAMNF